MQILMVSSEVVPFAKTGGLADVCGALPIELEKLGHDVSVFLPAYRSIYDHQPTPESLPISFAIPLGKKIVEGNLLQSKLPGSNVTVNFVNQPSYFHRHGLYGEQGDDFEDNSERFIFFCRAVLESIRLLGLNPDLIHCNDWQTALIPALLKCEYQENPLYESLASLFTIHNIAYQGSFWHWDMLLTGLDWQHFSWREMEHYGRLNLLKTGLVFADSINTVSPTYAREIQTSEHGAGMDNVLRHRANRLSGILNGIDTQEWNPATDRYLVANYSPPATPTDLLTQESLDNKRACKIFLQQQLRLTGNCEAPLIGIVGRLASQKGWSLILPNLRKWLEQSDLQWVILGSGDPQIENALEQLHRQHSGKLSVSLGFSNEMAHQIEAGADMFLMPSEYEPCGLNQMYSMAYGTIPIVRRTGGLADTVVHADRESILNRTATGFVFDEYTPQALEFAIRTAEHIFRHQPEVWWQLISTGMSSDWSWRRSAQQYVHLYQETIEYARQALVH